MLTVPGESDIAREIGQDVDPTAIFTARTALRGLIGSSSAFRASRPLSVAWRRTALYRVDAVSTGRRSLRNTCLDLLVATQSRDASRLPRDNMSAPTT